MTEAKWALDRSQLDRQLLGDLAALIAVHSFVNADSDVAKAIRAKVEAEIAALLSELWPTG